MSGLQIKLTTAGRAAIVNAENTGTAPVRIAQIGVTTQAFVPDAGMAALPGELKRLGTFAGAAVADDTIHVTIRDDSADAYGMRGFGLYLESGTLFAVYGQPDVILEKSAQAMLLLAADIRFADIDATSLSFGDTDWINPPATTTTHHHAERISVQLLQRWRGYAWPLGRGRRQLSLGLQHGKRWFAHDARRRRSQRGRASLLQLVRKPCQRRTDPR